MSKVIDWPEGVGGDLVAVEHDFDMWLVNEGLREPQLGPPSSIDVELVQMLEDGVLWRQMTMNYPDGTSRVSWWGPGAWDALEKI